MSTQLRLLLVVSTLVSAFAFAPKSAQAQCENCPPIVECPSDCTSFFVQLNVLVNGELPMKVFNADIELSTGRVVPIFLNALGQGTAEVEVGSDVVGVFVSYDIDRYELKAIGFSNWEPLVPFTGQPCDLYRLHVRLVSIDNPQSEEAEMAEIEEQEAQASDAYGSIIAKGPISDSVVMDNVTNSGVVNNGVISTTIDQSYRPTFTTNITVVVSNTTNFIQPTPVITDTQALDEPKIEAGIMYDQPVGPMTPIQQFLYDLNTWWNSLPAVQFWSGFAEYIHQPVTLYEVLKEVWTNVLTFLVILFFFMLIFTGYRFIG